MNRQTRLLLGLAAALVALVLLGVAVQTVRTLLWDLSYFLPPWLLTPVLLLGLALIALLVVQVGWPWWKRWQKAALRSKPTPAMAPNSRRDAAAESLGHVDRLIERIQDDISREGLQQERDRVAEELNRGDLVVVVFGTGSSGKTSLIRALLNDMVGKVGAPMGVTKTTSSYRLRLQGLKRGLQLVDTPGILEEGAEGISREELARRRAVRADLLVVVVDGDLRASELAVVQALSVLGKRLLLVLNKRDLRGLEEEKRLLNVLRNRCSALLPAVDVVACSAAPQSIPQPGKQPLQPRPDVSDLIQRLAVVLRAEGEELIADNILLQCRSLDSRGRSLLGEQRCNQAKRCVDRYSWIGAGIVAANPLPGVDLLSTAAVNAQMVLELATVYGVEMSRDRARDLAMSVGKTLAKLGIVKGAMSLLATGLSVTLPTLVLGQVLQGVAAAWLTRIAGSSFIRYFEQDQDWGDGGMQEAVQQAFELNRREASFKRFLESAMRQVVEPLQRSAGRLPPRPGPQEGGEASDRGHRER